MPSAKSGLVFVATTILFAFMGRSVFAFELKGVPQSLRPLEYNIGTAKGKIELLPLEKLAPPETNSEFMQVLTDFTTNKLGEKWTFVLADKDEELEGSFNILTYKPLDYLNGANIVGASFELFYCPAGDDPKPKKDLSVTVQAPQLLNDCPGSKNLNPDQKHRLHWIQRVKNNHAVIPQFSGVEDLGHGTEDNKIDIPGNIGQRDPFFDTAGFLLNLTREDYFKDIPTRPDIQNEHDWVAELYLAEVKDPENKPREVTIYNGIRWGWKNRVEPPQPTKTFSGTLTSGSQTDKFTLNNLTPGSYFYTWTNNNIPSNRCNPNTYLSATSGAGYNYDDDSSLVGDGFASALSGIVPDNGIIDLFVRAANGGRRGEDKGSYELNVKVYDDEAAPSHIINGGSGGGGVSRPRPGNTQQNPVLPNGTDGSWQVFSNVPGCRWYDPHTTYGFEFQALEDTLFTEILDFPVGEDDKFRVSVGNKYLGEFGPGDSVDFVSLLGQAVDNFKISDIDSLVGDTEETAFPIQLAFNQQVGSFKMRPFDQALLDLQIDAAINLGTLPNINLGINVGIGSLFGKKGNTTFPLRLASYNQARTFMMNSEIADVSANPEKVPEPTSVLGLLALSVWGGFQALKIKKDKQE